MMFQKIILPPSSGLKKKPNKQASKQPSVCYLLGLHFNPEDGGSVFI
jgi:hypothetical protein